MANVIYIGRDGALMRLADWKLKQADATYKTVREYDNAVVRVELTWSGRVVDPGNTFADYYPVFVLLVKNYKADGTLANDPVDSDKTFPNEALAVAAYQEFLKRWTECSSTETGAFVEADNLLAPPPPPDPNRPATESEDSGGCGAW